MSAEVLREAAARIRADYSDPDAAPFEVAVAEWLDFVARGREAIDGIMRTRLRFPANGTAQTVFADADTSSQLFRDTEARALAVARAYLEDSK